MITKRYIISPVGIFSAILLLVLWSSVLSSRGQAVPALSFSGQTINNTGSDSTRGYAFDVTAVPGVLVTGLSFYDQGGDGLFESHVVGLWDSNGVLLASATVPAGTTAPLDSNGLFREVTLALPIVLPFGSNYAVGAFFTAGSPDPQAAAWSSMATAPGISYDQTRFVNGPTLTFPTSTISSVGLPGGSFVVAPVPEPGTWSLLGVGLVIWAIRKQRSARRNR